MTWGPQKAIQIVPVSVSSTELIVSTETRDLPLFGCPDNAGYRIEVLSVSAICSVAPVITTGTVTLDLEHVDDSDSDAKTEIGTPAGSATAYDLEGITVNVVNELWRGSEILDPGDIINLEAVTGTTVATAAVGLTFLVEFKILDRS